MPSIAGFDCFPLNFDNDGVLKTPRELDTLIAKAKAAGATDAIFIAHGFRNDAADATSLYTKFLTTLRANLARPEFKEVAARTFVVAPIYWPSKPFRENPEAEPSEGTRGLAIRERALTSRKRVLPDRKRAISQAKAQIRDLKTGATAAEKKKLDKAATLLSKLDSSTKAQDDFVKLVLSVVDESDKDRSEGLPQVRKRKGSELLARLSPDAGTRGLGEVFGNITGGVGHFLNLTLWYVMKSRSGTVGADGASKAVRDVRRALPSMRIHLVGHSLGGRLMAACALALAKSPKLQPDSLMLLEAAFSHYGFSPDNGHGKPGFFRDVVSKQVVKGPFLSTFSAQDTVVGKAYSTTSRLARDNTREIGDAADEFGGIGRNGPLKTPEVATSRLLAAGNPYVLRPGVINNFDGSGGLIKNHSDVTSAAITYAFASALALT